MEESVECFEMRSTALPVIEGFLDHNDDNLEHGELDGPLDGDIAVQEKNKKKKKKHKGGLPSPRRILAFNTSELSKLDEHKAEMKKCGNYVVKTLSKSASFPSNATPKDNTAFVEGSGDSEDSRDYTFLPSAAQKISVLKHIAPLPLKSALRGSYAELGMGPRPKLQVKWAPTVWEPPSSTISHTVNKSRSKDPKNGKKGKSNHDGSHKRHEKKKHHKTKCQSGASIVRRHGMCHDDGDKEPRSLLQADSLNDNEEVLTSSRATSPPELQYKETDASYASCELGTHTGGGDVADMYPPLNLESSIMAGVHYPLESTCGGSLFEPERLACNFLYRQAT